MPKSNMYQSLHTTLISKSGQPFEIQIRTYDMHKTAEYGIAAHWKYKENLSGTSQDKEEAKLSWLRQILEWQRDTEDNKEFMSTVKTDLDLFAEQVYCFTPMVMLRIFLPVPHRLTLHIVFIRQLATKWWVQG